MFLVHLNPISFYSRLSRVSETKATVKECLSLYPEFKITESFEMAFLNKGRANADVFITDLRRVEVK